jgi:polysaccharide biosynthesis protein PslJ
MSAVVVLRPAPAGTSPPPRRGAAAACGLLTGALATIAAAMLLGGAALVPFTAIGMVLALASLAVARPMLAWDHILVVLILVIVFLPIRRYKVAGDLPFQLEPYRVLVGLIILGWVAALLVDARVRARRSGLEGPLALIMISTLASIVANPARVAELESHVTKTLTFLISFVVMYYVIVSVVRTPQMVDRLIKTLVAAGSVVALLAVVEARTGFSPFTHLHQFIPVFKTDSSFDPSLMGRGGATRATGPAEHPIALGAALVMLVPLAVYVARSAGSKWNWALGALIVGVLSTVSRTGVVMLMVLVVVYLILRPLWTRRLWPFLIPVVVATQIMVPGTLGSLAEAFFPTGGVIEEQQGRAGDCGSSGRVADLGPTLDLVGERPFVGYGYGTRITTGDEANACVLDNQWLGNLMNVGILGTVAWLLLFIAICRRLGKRAKRDQSPTGWLLVGVTASVIAYAVGSFTFDALSFIQVTFFLFLILGIGTAAARNAGWPTTPPPRRPLRRGSIANRVAMLMAGARVPQR